jgi:fluoroquinolone resistance protein
MEKIWIDEIFEKIDFTTKPLEYGEYEKCDFNNCVFSNTDISEIKFIDCRFTDCNLSLVQVVKTVLRDVWFKDCKMLGIRFDSCNQFALSFGFDGCILNHSSFYKTKIKQTIFKNTQLQGVDFTACDLTGAVFNDCNLLDAIFENTIIEKTDLRSSYNYSIDPEKNKIKKARFSLPGLVGLLRKYDITIE